MSEWNPFGLDVADHFYVGVAVITSPLWLPVVAIAVALVLLGWVVNLAVMGITRLVTRPRLRLGR